MKKEIPLEKSYGDDHVDDHVDKEIEDCFSTKNPKCFLYLQELVRGRREVS